MGTDKSRVRQLLGREGLGLRGSTLQAVVCEASRNRRVRTGIRIQFFFDSNGKRVSYEVKDFPTGP